MKTIEEYIKLSNNMENTSDGGSASYRFEEDGVVLIKYVGSKTYDGRENEEKIAESANQKNSEGVNTPKHLAYLRLQDEEKQYCYVLQELAKGKCMTKYQAPYGDIEANISGIKRTLEIPEFQIDKCVQDLISLYNMGLELKPKNFFYDPEFGFTFIDLLGYNQTPADLTSLKEIIMLFKYICLTLIQYSVTKYNKGATEEKINEFLAYKAILISKIFQSMEKNIPNFSSFKRYIYRSLDEDIRNEMIKKQFIDKNLELTAAETQDFNQRIKDIIATNLRNLEQGKDSYWNITTNTIRIEIDALSLSKSWAFHPNHPTYDIKDFESEYELNREQEQYLYNEVYKTLNALIKKKALSTDNQFIKEAYEQILAKEEQDRRYEEMRKNNPSKGFW